MTIDAVTSNPYAYLERDPGDAVARYVPDTAAPEKNMFGEDGFGFDDFLDIINPLQHIPFVSSLYREITGDQINPGARMVGGAIFSGGVGLAISFANSAIEDSTGKDVGEHFIALFGGSDDAAPEQMLAETPDVVKAPTAEAIPAATPPPKPEVPAILPAAPPAEEAPAMTPIGLEWKGEKPDFLLNMERAKALHTQDLSEEQLQAVFKSFKMAPAEPVVPARQATAAYQKAAVASPLASPVSVPAAKTDTDYSYLNSNGR